MVSPVSRLDRPASTCDALRWPRYASSSAVRVSRAGKGARKPPAEQRAVRCPTVFYRAGDMFADYLDAEPSQPVAAHFVLIGPAREKRPEAERLDHLSVSSSPQPGAAGDDRMRRRQRQCAADERHAVGNQAGAERRQEVVGPG